jgi:hypothetical protein
VYPLAEVGWLSARFTEPAPVPVSDTVLGLFVALLVMVRLPVWLPAAAGVNVTLTVQEALAAIDAPQVLLSAKSPLAAIWDIDTAVDPVLFTVTVCALLVVLSA